MLAVMNVFAVDNHVVLSGHVVGDVVIDDKSEQPVEQGQVDLLVELLKVALHHYIALSVRCLPYVL